MVSPNSVDDGSESTDEAVGAMGNPLRTDPQRARFRISTSRSGHPRPCCTPEQHRSPDPSSFSANMLMAF